MLSLALRFFLFIDGKEIAPPAMKLNTLDFIPKIFVMPHAGRRVFGKNPLCLRQSAGAAHSDAWYVTVMKFKYIVRLLVR